MDSFENIWPIHVEFTLTKQDVAYYYNKRYLRAKFVSLVLLAVYAVLFVLLGIYNNIPLYVFFLVLVVLSVYYLTKAPRETRKTWGSDKLLTGPQAWDLEFSSLTVTDGEGSRHVILWKEFYSFALTKEQVSYIVSAKRFLILPRRLLTHDQTKTLIAHSTNTILL